MWKIDVGTCWKMIYWVPFVTLSSRSWMFIIVVVSPIPSFCGNFSIRKYFHVSSKVVKDGFNCFHLRRSTSLMHAASHSSRYFILNARKKSCFLQNSLFWFGYSSRPVFFAVISSEECRLMCDRRRHGWQGIDTLCMWRRLKRSKTNGDFL